MGWWDGQKMKALATKHEFVWNSHCRGREQTSDSGSLASKRVLWHACATSNIKEMSFYVVIYQRKMQYLNKELQNEIKS